MDIICLDCEYCEIKEIGAYTTKFCKVDSIKLTGTKMKGLKTCDHYIKKGSTERKEIEEEQNSIICKECDDYLPSMNVCTNEVILKKVMRYMASQIVPNPNGCPEWCPRKIK